MSEPMRMFLAGIILGTVIGAISAVLAMKDAAEVISNGT
jgi:gas vesicle protein